MYISAWQGKTLGVIGGGNMAEALVRGVVGSGLLPAASITVFDPLPERQKLFAELGCGAVADAPGAAAADVVLLAVKPQSVREALVPVREALRPGALVISIAAGTSIASLAELLPPRTGIVRVMPNTPLLVGRGASALAAGPGVDVPTMRLAMELFGRAGRAHEVTEDMLDAVTALSGSGPAYLFRFAEALAETGAELGLPPELARDLTAETLAGAAEMLVQYGDPATLRRNVTSPGGTTAAALDMFEELDFQGIVRAALVAARRRSVELGKRK